MRPARGACSRSPPAPPVRPATRCWTSPDDPACQPPCPAGTELGDWGFLPIDPQELRAALSRR
ncbi:MAG TPA: hypothetical protein VFU21_32130, partial [Kofleriaceae bacterium]|nr:hypothetical protein [Kofleriaceae bacterium]